MAPIHNAAGSADAVTLRRLLEGGASPDEIDAATGQTPLHVLCLVGDRDRDRAACFEILRDAGANLEATFSDRRMTALHCAAYTRSPSLVSLLVEAGVNLNATHIHGKTALHFAVESRGDTPALRSRRIACCELLLKAGAAVNVVTRFGLTPFDTALNAGGHRRTFPLLLRAGAEFRYHTPNHPYILRVHQAGGFKRYEQAHLARITAILETPLLPPELVRKILEFWLHAGYY
jgi:ankyrin repeat protein